MSEIAAVIFDMDGVLIDSEQLWDEAREKLTEERGGEWHPGAQRAMMGMNSPEWSRYMHEELGVPDGPGEINAEVVRRLEALYRAQLPVIDGAAAAVSGTGCAVAAWARVVVEPAVDRSRARAHRPRVELYRDGLIRGGCERQARA